MVALIPVVHRCSLTTGRYFMQDTIGWVKRDSQVPIDFQANIFPPKSFGSSVGLTNMMKATDFGIVPSAIFF